MIYPVRFGVIIAASTISARAASDDALQKRADPQSQNIVLPTGQLPVTRICKPVALWNQQQQRFEREKWYIRWKCLQGNIARWFSNVLSGDDSDDQLSDTEPDQDLVNDYIQLQQQFEAMEVRHQREFHDQILDLTLEQRQRPKIQALMRRQQREMDEQRAYLKTLKGVIFGDSELVHVPVHVPTDEPDTPVNKSKKKSKRNRRRKNGSGPKRKNAPNKINYCRDCNEQLHSKKKRCAECHNAFEAQEAAEKAAYKARKEAERVQLEAAKAEAKRKAEEPKKQSARKKSKKLKGRMRLVIHAACKDEKHEQPEKNTVHLAWLDRLEQHDTNTGSVLSTADLRQYYESYEKEKGGKINACIETHYTDLWNLLTLRSSMKDMRINVRGLGMRHLHKKYYRMLEKDGLKAIIRDIYKRAEAVLHQKRHKMSDDEITVAFAIVFKARFLSQLIHMEEFQNLKGPFTAPAREFYAHIPPVIDAFVSYLIMTKYTRLKYKICKDKWSHKRDQQIPHWNQTEFFSDNGFDRVDHNVVKESLSLQVPSSEALSGFLEKLKLLKTRQCW